MSSCQSKTTTTLLLIAAAFCFTSISTTLALAQSSGSRRTPIDRRIEEMNRQGEQYERDKLRTGLDKNPDNSNERKPAQAITLQVKQDFERIQSVYNSIVLAMTKNPVLSYKFISDATAEVNKYARRLRKNLALPEPEANRESAKEVGDHKEEPMSGSLEKLCRHIISFVTNPLFETSGVLNVEQSMKASKDLEKIIELSGAIGENADKLRKAKNQIQANQP